MSIDNAMYSREDYRWWDPENDNTNTLLRCFINPIRFQYFQRVLEESIRSAAGSKKILDVGSGGGFLSEEFAKIGFAVTGVEPSQASREAAQAHAAKSSLSIAYVPGYGEALPFDTGTFDFVACCDVLEHVNDLNTVVSEISRVLRAGGVFFYDTINRSLSSKLFVIKVAQDWPWTAWEEPHTHDWEMFIRPQELDAMMKQCGLVNQETRGISSGANPLSALLSVRRRARGRTSRYEMGTRLRLHESSDTRMSYMGYAVKHA